MTRKLAARALFYAVIVSIFVAMISATILLGSYHQHHLIGRYQLQERQLDNCQSGIEWLLGTSVSVVPPVEVDLFGTGSDSVLLEQRAWGLLEVIVSKSWSGQEFYKDSVVRAALVGKRPPTYALKLLEGNAALYLYGETRIVGDAFLPREGVERGYANIARNKHYVGQQLIYGNQAMGSPVDKTAIQERFAHLEALVAHAVTMAVDRDSIVQGFDQAPVVVGGSIFNKAGLVLKGNVVVVANDYIEVGPAAVVEDILLVASTIIIKKGFRGSLQAFARDSLIVEAGVELTYPSVLSLLPYKGVTDFSPVVRIEEAALITGTILVPSFRYNRYQSKVFIAPTATVTGQVWVNGIVEHRGTVQGTILCEEFLLQLPTGVYKNYLLDATIDREALPKPYLSPSILGINDRKYILKYL